MDVYFVYVLIDTLIDEPVYVGITNHPYRRMREHRRGYDPLGPEWMRDRISRGYAPRMLLLDITKSKRRAKEIEQAFIDALMPRYKLVNVYRSVGRKNLIKA